MRKDWMRKQRCKFYQEQNQVAVKAIEGVLL